jgi:hypothetical protein
MKLGTIKTIAKEDLSKAEKLPAWMDPFLQSLNNFISNVTLALNGRLTFNDNFLATEKQINIIHSVETEINPDSKNKVKGVVCMSSGGLGIDVFKWRQLSNGNVGVTIGYDGGISTTNAICVITIFFE